MSLVKGRTDDMLIIRGVNLYPTEVALVLARFEELSVHHRLVLTREGTLDELAVEVEVRDDIFRGMGAGTLADEALEADETLQDLRSSVAARIKEILGVSARVVLRPPGSVPRSEGGKLARVDDRRRLD
jgi:phenylacetate-CoA ligase